MYQDDVLLKFVVIQHFVFGTILPFKEPNSLHVSEREDSVNKQ